MLTEYYITYAQENIYIQLLYVWIVWLWICVHVCYWLVYVQYVIGQACLTIDISSFEYVGHCWYLYNIITASL